MTQSGHDGDNADVTDSILRDNKFTHIAAYLSRALPGRSQVARHIRERVRAREIGKKRARPTATIRR